MNNGHSENPGKVGSVMVVGSGVGGMQAALDLAESGFKVYLTDRQSAIGGRMAQLDKTFPTNDCAMCTISPKLVEVGRHRNIELLVDTDVLNLDGEAGNFKVRVRTAPRYIDLEKCTGCSDCADVCPVIISDCFNEGLESQKAIHKLYPQAVPNAFAIAKLGVSPCRDACPAGQRAQGYVALIAEGRYLDAMRVIKEDNPFPGICGRICNHRCEDACSRGKADDPVNVRLLKRFVADRIYAEERVPPEPAERVFDERVAVIGAGPCGLTAALDLCKMGYGVTVFEALPVAGGMLRVGIPEYRLPSSVIEREVQDIVDVGVDLRLDTRVEDLEKLFGDGFKAVMIGVGAHGGRKLPIKGADLDGVLLNTDFLRDARLGAPPNVAGKRVVVLGGGNVAIDVARTAVRLGAGEVQMACLEDLDSMPAHKWEVEAAEAEGVVVNAARSFKRVLDDGSGGVSGLECVNVTFMRFEDDGRLTLETEPGSEHTIPADIVVFAIGQRVELGFLKNGAGVETTPQQTVAVDSRTMASSRKGVFAAGDAVTGTSFAVDAVAAGHEVAKSIHRYLRGESEEDEVDFDMPVAELDEEEVHKRLGRGDAGALGRLMASELEAKERVFTFAEVETGYTEAEAQAEASRCLSCGICSECLECVQKCKASAIDHNMTEELRELNVGAMVLASGFDGMPPEASGEYGYGRYPNVITSLEFERILSASGPYEGHVLRPSDRKAPEKVAWIQCVGSRDTECGNDYCSSVCCMYATKEAIVAREHDANVKPTIFFNDLRAFGKGFERYYDRAREQHGVRYVKSIISTIKQQPGSDNLLIRYATESGEVIEEEFELVVLSIGLTPSKEARELASRVGVDMNRFGFVQTGKFNPSEASRPGVFACGGAESPMDIPETVMTASNAAGLAAELLADARGTLVIPEEFPPERDISDEEPRVGVFVCHCGMNIARVVDVKQVVEYASTLEHVVHAEDNLYTCSNDTQRHIVEVIKEHNLNRVVVASCTPRTHEPLFQTMLREAGLNKYLFEMANIRDQCSWVHSEWPERATQKAKDLTRKAIARAATLEPLSEIALEVTRRGLVVGGGLAGITAALSLARQGFETCLVEKEDRLGGRLWDLRATLEGEDPRAYLEDLLRQVEEQPRLTVYTNAEVVDFTGHMGQFRSVVSAGGDRMEIEHGAVIVATGGVEHEPEEYLYGQDPRVITQLELEAKLGERESGTGDTVPLNQVVMIQCVGSREDEHLYCSRVCCSEAVKNALRLKELNPETQVVVLYRDMRTYGFNEVAYRRAREAGVLFLRYDVDGKPKVREQDGALEVMAEDSVLGRPVLLKPDLLVLSSAIRAHPSSPELGTRLKVPIDADGFFLEAHLKLRPLDFASEGIFLCGLAQSPKLIEETIAQGRGAAARAAIILSQDEMHLEGVVAQVDEDLCAACLTCVRVCPFDVPIIKDGAARIEAASCQGCGSCASGCPARAIQVGHYKDEQVLAKICA